MRVRILEHTFWKAVAYVSERSKHGEEDDYIGMGPKVKTYIYAELRTAAADFSSLNLLGEGGFGPVYKGILNDGSVAAMKQLSVASHHGKTQLIEANEILLCFDVGLRQYAMKHLTMYGVRLVRGVVKEVHAKKLILSDGSVVPYGLLVWSTGVGPSDFIKQLELPKSPGGRVRWKVVNELL